MSFDKDKSIDPRNEGIQASAFQHCLFVRYPIHAISPNVFTRAFFFKLHIDKTSVEGVQRCIFVGIDENILIFYFVSMHCLQSILLRVFRNRLLIKHLLKACNVIFLFTIFKAVENLVNNLLFQKYRLLNIF